jgi:methylthioribose-1-phosphate isomerase
LRNLEAISIRHINNRLEVLDQTQLPDKEVWLSCHEPKDMVEIIKNLQIRGAPAIGVAAALCMAQYAESGASVDEILQAATALKESRPTAVNLMWALDKQIFTKDKEKLTTESIVQTAEEIFQEDVELCERISENGADLISDGDQIITHCNTGALATAGRGTALGVFHKAYEQGKKIHVYVDETRPLLQGGRLTTWELKKLGIPYTLVCDNMAADLMQRGKVQKAFVGADRICANGDFANKVGTYSLAVNAKFHGVEFYSVAPYTTVDLNCPSGKEIPIEQRTNAEVRGAKGSFGDIRWAPEDCAVYNPAFDVTPVSLLTGIVTDKAYFTQKELEAGCLLKL